MKRGQRAFWSIFLAATSCKQCNMEKSMELLWFCHGIMAEPILPTKDRKRWGKWWVWCVGVCFLVCSGLFVVCWVFFFK